MFALKSIINRHSFHQNALLRGECQGESKVLLKFSVHISSRAGRSHPFWFPASVFLFLPEGGACDPDPMTTVPLPPRAGLQIQRGWL